MVRAERKGDGNGKGRETYGKGKLIVNCQKIRVKSISDRKALLTQASTVHYAKTLPPAKHMHG